MSGGGVVGVGTSVTRRETRQTSINRGERTTVGPQNTEPETSGGALGCLPPRDPGATVCVIRT